MTAGPLALLPSGYFIFLPVKWMLILVLVLLGLAAAIYEKRFSMPLLLPWSAFMASAILASIMSVDKTTSLIGSPGRNLGVIAWGMFACAFFLGASIEQEQRVRVFVAAAVTLTLVSVYGLLQSAGLDFIDWRSSLDVTRSRSTFGNAAFLGAYLVLVTPVAARLAFRQDGHHRKLFTVAAVTGIGCLLTTQGRGAWIGAVAATAFMVIHERHRVLLNTRRMVIVGAVALFVLVPLFLITPLGGRLASIADVSRGTARGRVIQWSLGLELIADRPLLGWGPDTLRTEFPRVIDPEFERTVGRDVIPDRMHNAYLDVAAAMGVVGLFTYVLLQISVFLRIGRAKDPLAVGIMSGLIGYSVQALFSFPLADVDSLFWFMAGAGVSLSPATTRFKEFPRTLAFVPLSLGLAALIWTGREVRADALIGRAARIQLNDPSAAFRLFDQAASSAPERIQYAQASARFKLRIAEATGGDRFFSEALKAIDGAIERYPRDGEVAMDQADILLAWGQSRDSQELLRRAELGYEKLLSRDPSSSRALLKLGIALVEQGETSQAERSWMRAATLAPRSPTPSLNLGRLYEQLGRKQDAIEQFEDVLRRDPSNNEAAEALERLEEK